MQSSSKVSRWLAMNALLMEAAGSLAEKMPFHMFRLVRTDEAIHVNP